MERLAQYIIRDPGSGKVCPGGLLFLPARRTRRLGKHWVSVSWRRHRTGIPDCSKPPLLRAFGKQVGGDNGGDKKPRWRAEKADFCGS